MAIRRKLISRSGLTCGARCSAHSWQSWTFRLRTLPSVTLPEVSPPPRTRALGSQPSYLIGEIITIPLSAWFSRVFSVRWYLLVNVAFFLIFSCLCGTARTLVEMIIYRAAQGFTGGVMIPMALTVALSTLPKSQRPVGFALFGMTATLAPAIGPSIGGWLTDNFGWEWVFYINLLPGALMIAAIVYAIEPKPLQLGLLRGRARQERTPALFPHKANCSLEYHFA